MSRRVRLFSVLLVLSFLAVPMEVFAAPTWKKVVVSSGVTSYCTKTVSTGKLSSIAPGIITFFYIMYGGGGGGGGYGGGGGGGYGGGGGGGYICVGNGGSNGGNGSGGCGGVGNSTGTMGAGSSSTNGYSTGGAGGSVTLYYAAPTCFL